MLPNPYYAKNYAGIIDSSLSQVHHVILYKHVTKPSSINDTLNLAIFITSGSMYINLAIIYILIFSNSAITSKS